MPVPENTHDCATSRLRARGRRGGLACRYQRRDGVLQPRRTPARWTTPSSTGARSAASHSSPAHAEPVPIASPGRPGRSRRRASACGTARPSSSRPAASATPRRSARPTRRTPHRSRGAAVSTRPGMRAARSSCTPSTLEFVAEVGHLDSWGGSSMEMPGVLPFLLSSAHPVADPERDCLWTVKLDFVMEPTLRHAPGGRPLRPSRRHAGAATGRSTGSASGARPTR